MWPHRALTRPRRFARVARSSEDLSGKRAIIGRTLHGVRRILESRGTQWFALTACTVGASADFSLMAGIVPRAISGGQLNFLAIERPTGSNP